MARKRLPAAKLYAVLEREFRARRPPECTTCHVPLPYWSEATTTSRRTGASAIPASARTAATSWSPSCW